MIHTRQVDEPSAWVGLSYSISQKQYIQRQLPTPRPPESSAADSGSLVFRQRLFHLDVPNEGNGAGKSLPSSTYSIFTAIENFAAESGGYKEIEKEDANPWERGRPRPLEIKKPAKPDQYHA